MEIYIGYSNEYYKYIWNKDKYAMKITSKDKIEYDELEKIIEGILPQK